MQKRSRSFFTRASFLHQLAATFAIGIICLALLSSIAISTLSSQTFHAKFIEQGLRATETLAKQSTLALLYLSTDNAEEPLQTTLGFPDIKAVGIYDLTHKALLTKGENPAPSGKDTVWPTDVTLELETPEAWYFVAPVYVHRNHEHEDSPFQTEPKAAELIGFVRVKMGKETLKTVAANILRTNLAVSVGLALVLLLLLLAITKRLTTPLKNLANIMRKASAGEKNLRADVRGPKDIIDMENAFNTMMAVLETRELQLENTRDAALESARAKGEFAANVSHELRTPLNGVLGMLELLQDMGLTPKQQEYVAVARNAGESLLKLIDDILDFSRTDSGKLKFQPIDFDLPEILDEVIGLLASQAQRKTLELGYSIAEEVPAALRGDPARIRQVLVNLVGNAIKFTEDGAVEITVKTVRDVTEGKDLLLFTVVDSGIGIPAGAQQRIFEAFTQMDGSTTRNYGGAGLGLAICRKLVNFMGGEIGVASQPGQGSQFWFTLPLDVSPQSPAHSKDKRDGLAGLRLLIVENGPVSRRLLTQLAKSWGTVYSSAANGYTALQMIYLATVQGTPYDVAILDESIPDLNGVELARHIAEDPLLSRLRIVLLTNQLLPGADEGRPDNIISSVSKPIRAQFLYDALLKARHVQKDCPPAAMAMKESQAGGFKKRILIAEDNRASQLVAVGMLERLGCEVRVAATGQEALALLENNAFDLVLMDCHMPQMDGYEAARRIRALEGARSQIPIIAMTANTQNGDSDFCIAAGMDDYLAKPLKLDLLRDKLGRWLAGAKDRLRPTAPAVSRSAAPESHKAAVLDNKVLGKLREETGEAFIRVIEVFLEDTPVYLQSLEKAIADEDFEALKEIAHCIKGSGRNLGAQRLIAVARQLEDLNRTESHTQIVSLFERLATEYELVKAELEQEIRPNQAGHTSEKQQLPRILVADDDRAMRFALLNVLKKDGYRIEQATNGVQAVSLCERQMPDLVLMDARMPKMDGFTACSRIRDLAGGSDIPVLIITALDDDHSIERAFSAGATDYIPKPVHFAVLRQRVARMLEASRAQQHVTRLAYQDALTGLPNRTLFRERLEASLNRVDTEEKEKLLAVLFLDLDRFKLANDTMGHEIGDLLLKSAAARIQECLRTGDMVSRFGGDEFTILLEDIGSPERAATLAERICKTIAKPFTFVGREFYLSTSIGIAMYPGDGTDSGTLIKHADMAMFRAKERGNTFRFFEDGMATGVTKRLRLESDLRRALEHDEFLLYYQPQVDLSTGKILGMEALVRWQHPDFGLVPPSQFISLAEETGLIEELGEWALLKACAQNKAWQDAGLPKISVAINLSARQLEMDFEARIVRKALADTGLDPRYLELELTETVVMKDPVKTRDILQRLKEAGISISIDDFGTGYSSLNHLKHFSFDKLKIDQSFIRDVHRNPEDAGIVLTIISMAQTLKLRVIAEGVETQEQLEYLQHNGCDEGQGYYFSKPLPPDEVAWLFQQERAYGSLCCSNLMPDYSSERRLAE
jgi:diguanylate cyclase (GGDEF)-like protein